MIDMKIGPDSIRVLMDGWLMVLARDGLTTRSRHWLILIHSLLTIILPKGSYIGRR